MSQNDLFITLLRPAVLHILRAAGFHGAKPSVVDTLVDLTARYMFLLASRTAYNAYSNHNDPTPDLTDVRMAMQDCGLLIPTMTGAEEIWKEILRKPLEEYDEETGARAKEEKRRLDEDTKDVKEFINWVKGDYNKEISRVAGTLKQLPTATETLDAEEMEDYLSTLMKKHSKTGVESRFQGTVLGHSGEPKPIRIEGGPVDSIQEWCLKTREQAAKAAKENPHQPPRVEPPPQNHIEPEQSNDIETQQSNSVDSQQAISDQSSHTISADSHSPQTDNVGQTRDIDDMAMDTQ